MSTKTAFVLMPFDDEFNDVYKHFIHDCLLNAGYVVKRADEIKGQNNILGDIVGGIIKSDLIVADLTGANPNVYYELGISHALNKNVILITQAIEELPFDLRSYRVVGYSTHFAKMNQARKELGELAAEAFNGTLPFGNPVKDFGSINASLVLPTIPVRYSESQVTVGDLGLLDFQVMLDDGFDELSRLLTGVGDKLVNELTPKITEASEKVIADNLTIKQRRDIIRVLANHLHEYGTFLKPENARYRRLLKDIESALENMLGGNFKLGDENAEGQLREFLNVLASIQSSANGAREQFVTLIDTMESLPQMEKDFNNAKNFMASELKTFVDNVDQTVSIIARAERLGNGLIKKLHGKLPNIQK
jgi:hypothetical protein